MYMLVCACKERRDVIGNNSQAFASSLLCPRTYSVSAQINSITINSIHNGRLLLLQLSYVVTPLQSILFFANLELVSAAWMILEAVPLIASPTVISSILSPEVREITRTAASSSRRTKYAY